MATNVSVTFLQKTPRKVSSVITLAYVYEISRNIIATSCAQSSLLLFYWWGIAILIRGVPKGQVSICPRAQHYAVPN